MTENEQVDFNNALSKATQLTVVEPRENKEPLTGLHDEFLTPEPSLTLKLYVAAMLVSPSGFRFWLLGHIIVGGTISTTDTANTGHDLKLPALSKAEQGTFVVPRLKVEPELGVHAMD